MMYRPLLFILLCISNLAFGQIADISKIEIKAKPIDPKKGYALELFKTDNEIKIYYHKVDSISRFSFSEKDQVIMKRLLGKKELYFDTLTKDSIAYFQHKIDSIRTANTFYKTDSATIYKSSHPVFWRYLEKILQTPNSILEKKLQQTETTDYWFFFTITQNGQEREVFIDSLDQKSYPLLAKLINDTIDIMKAHKLAMEKRH
jgi:hypothetical protein